MTPNRVTRFFARSVLTLGIVVLAGAGLTFGLEQDETIDPAIREGIESALSARVQEIGNQKNEKGESNKRASFSRSFHEVDASTYEVGMLVDTALEETLVTERYLVTVKKGGSGWKIAEEKLQDTYEGLHRGVLGDAKCFRFDGFKFDREGLRATATKGNMCQDYFMGKVAQIVLVSDDLAYEYTPPMPQDQALFEVVKKENKNDALFIPEYAAILCDPASCDSIISSSFTGVAPVEIGDLHPKAKKVYDDFVRRIIEERGKSPFAGFRTPFESDHRTYQIFFEREGMGDHALGLRYDNWEGNEVSFTMQGLGGTLLGIEFTTPLFTYNAEETRKSGLAADELERRPDPQMRLYDMEGVRGTLEMGFGDGETLVGDLTYKLTAKRALREIPFYIARLQGFGDPPDDRAPEMRINSLQDGEGNELTWVRVGPLEGIVVLPKEVPAGSPLIVRLQFVSKDLMYKVTPAFTNVDRGGWLPFAQFSDFIHEFDLTIKVPARYKTLGIGEKVSETVEGGANITRWVANKPVSFPAVIFGQYNEAESSVKAKKLDGTVIPVVMHVDKDSMADWNLTPKSLKKLADDAANALNLYTQIFQVDYPYDKLDLVNDPAGIFYAQAPSSLIYVGSPVFISKGVLAGGNENFEGGGASIAQFTDSVVPHEVAHQWWGSLIIMANFRNYWFIESLAEYSSALFMENAYGRDAYLQHINLWRDEVLENDMRSAVQNGYTEWQGPGGFGPFRAALYSKGPYAFHIMRETWGDEAFFKFLRSLVQDMKGKEIVTRDIQMVAEKTFGANLDWFFDQWLRGVGLPEYTFTYNVRPTEDGKQMIEGEVTQRVCLKPALANKEELKGIYFTGIVPITVVGKSGQLYKKRVIFEGGPTATFKFVIPEKPKEIVFNKGGESLSYDIVDTASK